MSVLVKVYTTPICPYCIQAKTLLDRKGANYEEIDLSKLPAQERTDLMQRTKQRTVPQIFIGETFVGGYDQLYALERDGKLDDMLAGN